MKNKSAVFSIIGVVVVVALIILAADFFVGQTPDQNIELETTSSSSQYFRLHTELPSEDMVGAEVVRSYISSQNEEFVAMASKEGPEVAQVRGQEVQFTQDVLVDATTTERFISYRVEIGSYVGGANANSTVKTFVFSKAGNQLSNDDLIASERQDSFMSALRTALVENPNTFPEVAESVNFSGLNLYITKDNIVVPFSEYEIGPGAAGVIVLELPRLSYINRQI